MQDPRCALRPVRATITNSARRTLGSASLLSALIVLTGGLFPSAAQPTPDSAATGPRSDTVYTIGEIVVTAARRAGSLFEAPLAMTILQPRDIRAVLSIGIDEALVAVLEGHPRL